MSEPAPAQARGHRHCGAVRFVTHCHCESCQRALGAAFVPWVGSASPQFEVTAGAGLLAAHASSPWTVRRFCRRCGTKLFFEGAKRPGETHVPLTAFDDPVDCAPQSHSFAAEHSARLPFALSDA